MALELESELGLGRTGVVVKAVAWKCWEELGLARVGGSVELELELELGLESGRVLIGVRIRIERS